MGGKRQYCWYIYKISITFLVAQKTIYQPKKIFKICEKKVSDIFFTYRGKRKAAKVATQDLIFAGVSPAGT